MSSTADPPSFSHSHSNHGFFWYLIVLNIEIALFALVIVVTRQTVSKRSGLNEPDKIRRIWARAPEIRFQPVKQPLTFAVAVSYGAQTVLYSFVLALLSLVGFSVHKHKFISGLLGFSSLGFSSLISILIYRATGGTNWKVCAVTTLAFDTLLTGLIFNIALGIYSAVSDASGLPSFIAFIAFLIGTLLLLAVVQTPFYIWGAYLRLPATARLIYNTTIVPSWVRLDRTVLMVSVPLSIIYTFTYLVQFKLVGTSYFSKLVAALATLITLGASALTSIISVNRALLSNEFQWQWRAFLTPAIPLCAIDFVVHLLRAIFGSGSFLYLFYQTPHVFLSSGSSGVLGAYVYLILAERYAQQHCDEDLFAQNDLLDDYEEDLDNEELDVEV